MQESTTTITTSKTTTTTSFSSSSSSSLSHTNILYYSYRNTSSYRFIEELQQYYKKQSTYNDYPEDFPVVQAYVQRAVQTRHDTMSSSSGGAGGAAASPLLQGYESICDQIKNRDEPSMLHKVLLALAYGETLGYLIQFPQYHGKLLHLIMRLDPFVPPPKVRLLQRNSTRDIHITTNTSISTTATTTSTTTLLVPSNPELLCLFQDYTIADAYFALCLAIISANATFVIPVLETMVRHWSNESIPRLKRQQNYDQEGRMLRVHATIYNILRLVPNATSQLFPIIAKYFPYKTRPKELISAYVEQILAVLHYAPSLFANIYELCIRHALQIDVEIRIQDDGNVLLERQQAQAKEEGGEEENIHASNSTIFQMDDEKKEAQQQQEEEEIASNQNDKPNSSSSTTVKVDAMADKLDTIMCLIFEHLTTFCQLKIHYLEAYDALLHIFESNIMMTHKSKFVQFILLFLFGRFQQSVMISPSSATGSTTTTSHDPLYREFASNLINKILDVRQPNIYRQVSACYLASFISRAKYVDDATACETVAVLLQWSHHYIAYFDRTTSTGSNSRAVESSNMCVAHGVFYSVCQAAFYIMCFRGADAWMHYDNTLTRFSQQHIEEEGAAAPENGENNGSMDNISITMVDIGPHRWLPICAHPRLKPLKFCLGSVRREFLHLAKVLKLLPSEFVRAALQHDQLLEAQKLQRPSTNGRKRRSSTIQTAATIELKRKSGGVGGLGKGSNPLDSFFPFDPYLLCRSHKFISPFYKSWDEPPVDLEDSSSSEDDDSIEDADEETSSSDSDSSSDSESYSMVPENELKHQDTQGVVDMLPCSFEEEIQSYRKHSISSGGSW